MKRFLVLLFALFAASALFGQNYSSQTGVLTSSGSGCTLANNFTPPTNCTMLLLPANASTAVVTLSGTFSATVQFEISADNTNFVAANAAPQPSGAIVSSATGAGTWSIPVAGMTIVRARASSYASGQVNVFFQASTAVLAQQNVVLNAGGNSIGSVGITNTAGSTDPCQNPSVVKSSAKISLSSTTASQLVALASGKIVYVCGFSAVIQGSATTVGTLQFEYGTQTTNPCDTGATTLTPALPGNISPNVPTVIPMPGGYTQFATTASQQLCAVATGTTISVQGYVTYVQQ